MAKQTFTTGQVLTAAQMTSLQQTAMGGGSPSTKTASYVLVAADAGTVIQMNSASSTTITVNTALFSAGDSVQIQNIGAGVCTITAGTATVTTNASLALAQWAGGILYFTSASAAIFFKSDGAAASSGPTYAIFRDEKTSGTAGGTFTSGAWRTRDLNTSQYNGITNASLSSNQITLAAGTYMIDGFAQGVLVSIHQTRFQNITDSTTAVLGQNAYAEGSSNVANYSRVSGVFTITGQKTFEFQHRATTTKADNGFGVAGSFGTEVYASITITKVA